jgi:hypothetical protein
MSLEPLELHHLVDEIKRASANIATGDQRTASRFDEVERSVNELFNASDVPAASPNTTIPTNARMPTAFAFSSTICSNRRSMSPPPNMCHRAMRSTKRCARIARCGRYGGTPTPASLIRWSASRSRASAAEWWTRRPLLCPCGGRLFRASSLRYSRIGWAVSVCRSPMTKLPTP